MSRLRSLAERLIKREHGLNTAVNTPPERVHPGAAGVNTLLCGKINHLEPENERVHVFTPQKDERVNTLRSREHADEHGVNTVEELAEADRLSRRKPELIEILRGDRCRRCGEPLAWPAPVGVVYSDGSAEHHHCRLFAAAERAVLSPDALADEAELTVRGEPLP
jgi:hypothetical protein